MCDICHKTPCDSRCPNAPDPATIYECAHCGQPIVSGDYYYCHDNKYYHEDCFGDAAPSIFAEEQSLKSIIPDTDDESEIGKCPICHEPVLECEDRWKGQDIMYHHECVMDNAIGLLNQRAHIAEQYD